MKGVTPDFDFGAQRFVIGVDEAGRGPLAGPVVAAACVLGTRVPNGLNDSKKLSAKRRAAFDKAIRETCAFAIAVVEPEEIDRVNIFQATMLALTRCARTPVRGVGLASARDRGRRRDRACDQRRLHSGQGAPRSPDDRGGRAPSRIRVGTKQGVWD